ncbi:MAG: GAF and ANTAR domain-containing protein [Acidimicrobiales bacterium]
MDPSEDAGIAAVLVQMGGALLGEQTVDRTLDLVTELAQRTVRSASAVSVTLRKADLVFTSNASEPIAEELDAVQYATQEGPCLQAISEGRIVNTAFDADEDRWPKFTAAARAEGIGGILSVPLTMPDRSIGALNIYSRAPHRFTDEDETTASLLAQQATAVLANVHAFAEASGLNSQLRDALASRDLIGQAKGILMARESCTAEEAFDILRRASQRTNRKLRDIASDLVMSVSDPKGPS